MTDLRNYTLSVLNLKDETVKKEVEPILLDLAKNDKKTVVRGNAISKLGKYKKPEYADLFKAATKDSSYTVSGNALEALSLIDEAAAMAIVKELSKTPSKGALKETITTMIAKTGDESMAEELIGGFEKMPMSQGKFKALNSLGDYLGAIKRY